MQVFKHWNRLLRSQTLTSYDLEHLPLTLKLDLTIVSFDFSEILVQMFSNIGRLEILKVYKRQNTEIFEQD